MTLRVLYAFLGLITFMSSAAFLVLFHPPYRNFPRGKGLVARRTWWLSVREGLLWLALAGGGFRVFVVNATKLEQPIPYGNAIELWISIGTIAMAAIASCVSLGVYLSYRFWEKEPLE